MDCKNSQPVTRNPQLPVNIAIAAFGCGGVYARGWCGKSWLMNYAVGLQIQNSVHLDLKLEWAGVQSHQPKKSIP